jgi:hypothetical protein
MSDRRSGASSPYGRPPGAAAPTHAGRPSQSSTVYDLAAVGPPPGVDQRARRDSASTFFSPTQQQQQQQPQHHHQTGRTPGSAGYNRQSYFDTGREEPLKDGYEYQPHEPAQQDWDVYADFNNAGPKYSSLYGAPEHACVCTCFKC